MHYVSVENTSSKNTKSNVKVNAKISEYILLCRLKRKSRSLPLFNVWRECKEVIYTKLCWQSLYFYSVRYFEGEEKRGVRNYFFFPRHHLATYLRSRINPPNPMKTGFYRCNAESILCIIAPTCQLWSMQVKHFLREIIPLHFVFICLSFIKGLIISWSLTCQTKAYLYFSVKKQCICVPRAPLVLRIGLCPAQMERQIGVQLCSR